MIRWFVVNFIDVCVSLSSKLLLLKNFTLPQGKDNHNSTVNSTGLDISVVVLNKTEWNLFR